MIHSLIIAFSMYSKIPMPKTDWSEKNMKYVMCFFPLVGVVIGGFILLWSYIGTILQLSRVFQAIVMILIPLMITGGIHMDGLLDTADALSSYQPREKKLEILKDPNTGAFAVITCVGYFFLSFGVWYEASLSVLPLLVLTFILSRSLSGLSIVTFSLAKTSGLAAAFSNQAKRKITRIALTVYVLLCSSLMLYLNWRIGLISILSALGVFCYYHHIAYKEFGGITGDLAGYFLQLCELVMAVSIVMGDKLCG